MNGWRCAAGDKLNFMQAIATFNPTIYFHQSFRWLSSVLYIHCTACMRWMDGKWHLWRTRPAQSVTRTDSREKNNERWGRKRWWRNRDRKKYVQKTVKRQTREKKRGRQTETDRMDTQTKRCAEGMIISWQKHTLTFFTRPWPVLSPGQGHALCNLRNLGAAYLAVETNNKQHEEEKNRPQRGDGQFGDSLRVRHKGQAWAWKNKGLYDCHID